MLLVSENKKLYFQSLNMINSDCKELCIDNVQNDFNIS